MPLPTFDGTDPIAWLARAAQYFLVHQTPVDQRVPLAVVALSGPALPWIQLLLRRHPDMSWDVFSRELLARFSDDTAIDSYEALRMTRHEGSLTGYIALLEARLAQTTDIPDHRHMGYFLGGLKPHLRMQIKDANIPSYSAAIQLAKRMDMLSSSSSSNLGSSPSTNSYSRPISEAAPQPPYRSFSASANSSTAPTGPRFPRRIRSMSNDEYRKHLATGTCFKCGLKYGPTHKCPPKTINVLVGDVEDDSTEDFHDAVDDGNNDSDLVIQPSPTHFELSALSSNGLDNYRTMKLLGYFRFFSGACNGR